MPNLGGAGPSRYSCRVRARADDPRAPAEAPPRQRVLVVDDDPSLGELLVTGLGGCGYEAEWRGDAREALAVLGRTEFAFVVTDLSMPGMDGIELCKRVVAEHPRLAVIVMTAHGSLEGAVSAMRAGARDFIVKPFEVAALALTLERAAYHGALREEVQRLRQVVAESRRFDEIVGGSPVMRELFELLSRVAQSDSAVLITGETGTGKELVARALHRNGKRKNAPFVAINCAAVPGPLLEAELFGYAKGAFTDAREARTGLFQQAHAGTLFLDEIGELPLTLQPKLLRALQERVVRPLGARAEVPIDVRLIAATNMDVEEAVLERRLREDLYFRINVIHLNLPPLRARGSDVLLLAEKFLRHFAAVAEKQVTAISRGAAAKLLAYPWPGNVRELQNCIERAVALTPYPEVSVDDLPERIRSYQSSHVLVAGDDPSELVTLAEMERRYVLKVVEAVGGQRTRAAGVLGLDRKTLYRKLQTYARARKKE